ncbi:hypothetical protein FGO68_gene15831 [Halteria grandinella]|uniref:Transmembrane protein n=1 Tax=Halteria grandinella TaxID=5974 RepID=A0A8J8NQI9_HALGN|nr:hypothetical protein FGO68_gene15831 [Halteria grandinella]
MGLSNIIFNLFSISNKYILMNINHIFKISLISINSLLLLCYIVLSFQSLLRMGIVNSRILLQLQSQHEISNCMIVHLVITLNNYQVKIALSKLLNFRLSHFEYLQFIQFVVNQAH